MVWNDVSTSRLWSHDRRRDRNAIIIIIIIIEMHDEIFHFEIFKNFIKILQYFKTSVLKYFMKLLILNIKWLKTFKNMTKVYQVSSSRRYIMLFMHNNKYLPLSGLLTLLQWTIHNTACIVLHPAKYFDIYGVKWRQYVTPVVVCEHLCWLVNDKRNAGKNIVNFF